MVKTRMKFISASAMRSRLIGVIGLILCLVMSASAEGTVLERIIALVGESPVYYSEFLEFRMTLKEAGRYRSDDQVMEELVNRKLLELEAMRLHLDTGVSDEQALIERYLELAVRGSLTRSGPSGDFTLEGGPGSMTAEQDTAEAGSGFQPGGDVLPPYELALERKLSELRERYGVRINPTE